MTPPLVRGCAGRHLPPTSDQPQRLEWQPVYGTVRVLDATCWRCAHLSYEWCSLGGAYLIRRTDRTRLTAPVVEQTAPTHYVLARSWWQAVLVGRAV